MQIDIVNIEGKKVGQADARRRRLRRRGQGVPPLGDGQGAARGEARRHALDQDPRRGPRRRQEAVQAEGHRQRAPGLDSRAPNFVGGGKVFGPQPRDYAYTVPKKVKRAALGSALSLRAKEKKLVVVDELDASTRPRPSGWPASSRRWASTRRVRRRRKTNANLSQVGAQPAGVEVPGRPRGSTSTTSSTIRAWSSPPTRSKTIEARVLPAEEAAA